MTVVPSEAPAQCGSDWIFDNKVERASREKSFEFKFERSHKLNQFTVVPSGMAVCSSTSVGEHFRFQTRV